MGFQKVRPLEISSLIFSSIEKQSIKHCHWKSNQHLEEALHGMTDIDLLVEGTQDKVCRDILEDLDCKQVITQPWSLYPGVEDWIGFDQDTGSLIHIHLHFQLIIGRRHLKEYHLPWEGLILDTVKKHPTMDVFIIDPSLELIILAIRAATKTSFLRILCSYSNNKILPDNILKELSYLGEKSNVSDSQWYAKSLLGYEQGKQLNDIVSSVFLGGIKLKVRDKLLITYYLKPYLRIKLFQKYLLYLRNLIFYALNRIGAKISINYQVKKRLKHKGKLIAVIGADGAGKTTLTGMLYQWLSWKLDVKRIYLGSGDSSAGLIFTARKIITNKKTIGERTSKTEHRHERNSFKPNSKFRIFIGSLFDVYVSGKRTKMIKRAKKLTKKNIIVITDRYPQKQYPGICDGPSRRVLNNHTIIGKVFAYFELRRYAFIGKNQPDIIIKLIVPDYIAIQRKPDHDISRINEKNTVIQNMLFPGSVLIEIDASKPIEEVLLNAKKELWKLL